MKQFIKKISKITASLVVVLFGFNTVTIPISYGQVAFLPAVGSMVNLTPKFNPPLVRGVKLYPDNPFKFDFIVDTGDLNLSQDQIKEEGQKLASYFLASLTTPEKEMWVNLSPYEKSRVIPSAFGQTEMGKEVLAQDYMLKQIMATALYPERELGKEFWAKVYDSAAKKFGTTKIAINTFNKVWILPVTASVYENAKMNAVFVVDSKLKVMLEQDYLAANKAKAQEQFGMGQLPAQDSSAASAMSSQIIKEIVIPALEKEVNEGKNFAPLRQVYQSLILATWYKMNLKDSVLTKGYADKNKVQGVNVGDPKVTQKIYEQYLKAYRKGAYNYIKEEVDPATNQIIPRKYFSGGANLAMLSQLKEVSETVAKKGMKDFTKVLAITIVALIAYTGSSQAATKPEPVVGAGGPFLAYITSINPGADLDTYNRAVASGSLKIKKTNGDIVPITDPRKIPRGARLVQVTPSAAPVQVQIPQSAAGVSLPGGVQAGSDGSLFAANWTQLPETNLGRTFRPEDTKRLEEIAKLYLRKDGFVQNQMLFSSGEIAGTERDSYESFLGVLARSINNDSQHRLPGSFKYAFSSEELSVAYINRPWSQPKGSGEAILNQGLLRQIPAASRSVPPVFKPVLQVVPNPVAPIQAASEGINNPLLNALELNNKPIAKVFRDYLLKQKDVPLSQRNKIVQITLHDGTLVTLNGNTIMYAKNSGMQQPQAPATVNQGTLNGSNYEQVTKLLDQNPGIINGLSGLVLASQIGEFKLTPSDLQFLASKRILIPVNMRLANGTNQQFFLFNNIRDSYLFSVMHTNGEISLDQFGRMSRLLGYGIYDRATARQAIGSILRDGGNVKNFWRAAQAARSVIPTLQPGASILVPMDSALLAAIPEDIALENPDVVGGIDLEKMNVMIKNGGAGIKTAFSDPKILEMLRNAPGLFPQVQSVTPMTVPMVNNYLGFNLPANDNLPMNANKTADAKMDFLKSAFINMREILTA